MRKFGMLASVVIGLLAVSIPVGLRAAHAQTPTSPLPFALEPKSPTRTVEFRILAPDGKVSAHLFADLEQGQKLLFANFQRINTTQSGKTNTVVCRFEGKGTIKTMRNGSAATLLQTDRDDAVVEYTYTKTAPATAHAK